MMLHQKNILILFIVLCAGPIFSSDDATEHHVICALKKKPMTKKERDAINDQIHQATYDLNLACKKLYQDDIETNNYYRYHRNTVFIIHINHRFNSWTLFKPSFIDFNKFVTLVKKIYRKHGLYVQCYHDQLIEITKSSQKLSRRYLTLDEFEEYKKMSDEKIDAVLQDESHHDYELYTNIKKMKDLFFWHLQIPTTGLLQSDRFDIDNAYKPLAWHYLLWDLAPKKGQGANVAIIDTGASAFNVQEKEFENSYKKNINITAPNNLQDYGYNLISKDGLDPIRQIAINLANFCDHTKFDSNDCMEKLPEMIIDVVKNKNQIPFEQYFTKLAKNRYLETQNAKLNKDGENVLKDLLYGKYGIEPSGKDSFFHITHLQAPYNEEVLIETLPAPKITFEPNAFAAGHGTFTQGVVNGKKYNNLGITGLAPNAQVTMIKAFNDRGTTNKTTLNAALQRAITLKNPIVSMSLKITDEIDTIKDAHLKELIDSIDYVVAASGNDGQLQKLKNKEAYPAKFDSVAFDVGAFDYANNEYPVCPFTQMELNIGPKFVAPGSNLFSSGLTPGQTADSMYVFMSGTSIAVPVITGFMALVLAEFQDVFSREQILKVVYKFSIKLGDDQTWQKYIKLGTPDMRSALLCLHALQLLKSKLQNNSSYSFATHFDNLVEAIYNINYYVPSCYEKKIHASFTNNFAKYYQAVKTIDSKIEFPSFYQPTSQDLAGSIDFIVQQIVNAIDSKKPDDTDNLSNQLRIILTTKKYNIFANAATLSQARIKAALLPRKSCLLSEQ